MSKNTTKQGTSASKNTTKQGTSAPKTGASLPETREPQSNSSAVEPLYAIDLIDWTNPANHDKGKLIDVCTGTIETVLMKQEGLASKLAQTLYIFDREKLYEETDYSSTAKWAEGEFGMSKSTVSESLKVFGRFGTRHGIADRYAKYNFSSLIKMASFEDKELDFMGIEPSMSRAQIVARIKDFKDLQKELPKLSDSERSAVEQKETLKEAEDEFNRIEQEKAEQAKKRIQDSKLDTPEKKEQAEQEKAKKEQELVDKVSDAMDKAMQDSKEERKLEVVNSRLANLERMVGDKASYDLLAKEIAEIREIISGKE